MELENILIGPNPCNRCGGEYGEHTETCPNGQIKRTPEEWQKIKNLVVLDPDGWRHDNKDFNDPLTEEEWTYRQQRSTCMTKPNLFGKNPKVVDKKKKR